MKTKGFKKSMVLYRGKEVSGLTLPASVQRLTNVEIPAGYVSNGKQLFSDGLKITFIPADLKSEKVTYLCHSCGKRYENKKGWISSRRCAECGKSDAENLKNRVKGYFNFDSSDENKKRCLYNSLHHWGFANRKKEVEKIISENWM
jgi:uncharacterized protein YlaI